MKLEINNLSHTQSRWKLPLLGIEKQEFVLPRIAMGKPGVLVDVPVS